MLSYAEHKLAMASVAVYPDQPMNRRYRAIIDAVPPGSRVLDIACGSGKLMASLEDKQCTCTGIDISPGAFAASRARGLDVLCGDVDSFDSEPEISELLFADYDAVIFSKCLMYLKRKNELLGRLRTKQITVCQENPIRWKNIVRRAFRPREDFERLPYVTADGRRINEFSLSGLREWGASYGYSMRVLHGSFFRSRDMVFEYRR